MTSDPDTARGYERRPGYPTSLKPANKRVRVMFAGATIVDAARAMVMFEGERAPVYYFERDEVRIDLLTRTTHSSH